jgi:DNA-binding NarL/FixJ family response regulator
VPRVLLVDDNALVRRLLREQLTARGALEVVGEAGDAATAIELAAALAPDLVVLDLSMPGMDGFAAIGALLEASPASQIVVMSGYGADQVAERVMAAGAAAYLEKGLRLDFTDALLEVLAVP